MLGFQVAAELVPLHQKTQNPHDSCFSVLVSMCLSFLIPAPPQSGFQTHVTWVTASQLEHLLEKAVTSQGRKQRKRRRSYAHVEENSSSDLIASYSNLLLKCQQHLLMPPLLNLSLNMSSTKDTHASPGCCFVKYTSSVSLTKWRLFPENSNMETRLLDWEYWVISEEVSLSGISLLWSITKCWKTQTQQIFISYCSSGWNASARVPTKSAHLFSVVNYQCSFAFLYHRKGESFLYVLPLLGHKSHSWGLYLHELFYFI